MNVLFLTMSEQMLNISASGIYPDLARKFRDEGHQVYVMIPFERRTGKKTKLYQEHGIHFLGVQTLNVVKTNVIEKGIGQVLLEGQFTSALKKYLNDVKFDLIMYSTPPITFTTAIKAAKKFNPGANAYLMLKDIFPQNAVDLGMLSKSGLKGLMYHFFRKKEEELYRVSNYIGCMSPANVKYVLEHNPKVVKRNAQSPMVEICPNSYNQVEIPELTADDKSAIRTKYNLPTNKPIFIYGGNMGKPQGIPFLIQCLDANKNREDCHFVIVGDGFDYPKLEAWYNSNKPKAVSLLKNLPKVDYDALTNACDIGLIFLDYRFTIPNYPSRLLPYLMSKKPIIAVTDPNCDTGTLAEANGYGLYCPSNSVDSFVSCVEKILSSDLEAMGNLGYQFFLQNYTIDHTYNAIVNHIKN